VSRILRARAVLGLATLVACLGIGACAHSNGKPADLSKGSGEGGLASATVTDTIWVDSTTASVTDTIWEDTTAAEAAIPRAARVDTTIEDFLGNLSDSTDEYFGLSSAPVDTTGNDSALAYGLANPRVERPAHRFGLAVRPDFTFSRVNGPTYAGEIGIGQRRSFGELYGDLGYAVGPNDWLGGGGYRRTGRVGNALAAFTLFGGRETETMNRDIEGFHLASFRALVSGKDYRSYFRREGVRAKFELERETWRVGVGYRDMHESALVTTTTWNLRNRDLIVVDNLAASAGRVREMQFTGTWRVPGAPVTAEFEHVTAGSTIGSDLEYRRTRGAVSGDFGLGQIATFVPQVSYGRLTPVLIPQEAFYLGGSHSLHSLEGEARAGTGLALARVDLIGAQDILALAHIPHPAMMPIQAGLFGGVGAVWGPDPHGGPGATGDWWPERNAWLGEVGASLIYQPGIPDPLNAFRFNYAVPLGSSRNRTRWSISYMRAIDLVNPLGN
jgi:hypothetical protein